MDIQTALATAVKCLIRVFSDINRIGSNIRTVLLVSSEISDFTPCAHALSDILHIK